MSKHDLEVRKAYKEGKITNETFAEWQVLYGRECGKAALGRQLGFEPTDLLYDRWIRHNRDTEETKAFLVSIQPQLRAVYYPDYAMPYQSKTIQPSNTARILTGSSFTSSRVPHNRSVSSFTSSRVPYNRSVSSFTSSRVPYNRSAPSYTSSRVPYSRSAPSYTSSRVPYSRSVPSITSSSVPNTISGPSFTLSYAPNVSSASSNTTSYVHDVRGEPSVNSSRSPDSQMLPNYTTSRVADTGNPKTYISSGETASFQLPTYAGSRLLVPDSLPGVGQKIPGANIPNAFGEAQIARHEATKKSTGKLGYFVWSSLEKYLVNRQLEKATGGASKVLRGVENLEQWMKTKGVR